MTRIQLNRWKFKKKWIAQNQKVKIVIKTQLHLWLITINIDIAMIIQLFTLPMTDQDSYESVLEGKKYSYTLRKKC